ncbi:hypothetical protein [Lactovum odontotermitis]
MMSPFHLTTATTPSKLRTDLTAFLRDVTAKDLEVHIVRSSGGNAVLLSEESLNQLKERLAGLEMEKARRERLEYINDPKTRRYKTAAEMTHDVLGDLYDQLSE